jgi:hypothetical protein
VAQAAPDTGPLVIRPRVQIPILVMLFATFLLIGLVGFAHPDRFDIVLSYVLVPLGLLGIWRSARLGVVMDAQGIHIHNLDRRDKHLPWSAVASVDCGVIDIRAGLSLYAPIILFHDPDRAMMPVPALGAYSPLGAERKAELLRTLMTQAQPR